MGTHTFMRAPENQPSGIREAAFRVVLRQEIVFAFKTQSPLQLLPEYVLVDRSMDKSDDWTLAFHIIVLCAEVLGYCYGDDPNPPGAWDDLAERARCWMGSKSASFEPLYCVPARTTESQVFPEIWLLNDCHGMRYIYGRTEGSVMLTSHSCSPPALLNVSNIARSS